MTSQRSELMVQSVRAPETTPCLQWCFVAFGEDNRHWLTGSTTTLFHQIHILKIFTSLTLYFPEIHTCPSTALISHKTGTITVHFHYWGNSWESHCQQEKRWYKYLIRAWASSASRPATPWWGCRFSSPPPPLHFPQLFSFSTSFLSRCEKYISWNALRGLFVYSVFIFKRNSALPVDVCDVLLVGLTYPPVFAQEIN